MCIVDFDRSPGLSELAQIKWTWFRGYFNKILKRIEQKFCFPKRWLKFWATVNRFNRFKFFWATVFWLPYVFDPASIGNIVVNFIECSNSSNDFISPVCVCEHGSVCVCMCVFHLCHVWHWFWFIFLLSIFLYFEGIILSSHHHYYTTTTV